MIQTHSNVKDGIDTVDLDNYDVPPEFGEYLDRLKPLYVGKRIPFADPPNDGIDSFRQEDYMADALIKISFTLTFTDEHGLRAKVGLVAIVD